MHEEHGFNLLAHIPGLKELPNHVGMTVLVALILVGTTVVARALAISSDEGNGWGLSSRV